MYYYCPTKEELPELVETLSEISKDVGVIPTLEWFAKIDESALMLLSKEEARSYYPGAKEGDWAAVSMALFNLRDTLDTKLTKEEFLQMAKILNL